MDPLKLLGMSSSAGLVALLEEEWGPADVETIDEVSYYSCEDAGLSVTTDRHGNVDAVFLYLEPYDGFARYSGQLPHGIEPSWDRGRARLELGPPSGSGGARGEESLLGAVAPWDVFFFPAYSLHLEFDLEGKRITRVTVSTPEGTPGRDS